MNLIRGKVWKFGDNISTDLLMPSVTMFGQVSEEDMKHYCMYIERPDFAKNVKKGDIVVAGKNFGCGSSRPAAMLLLGLGISCVLADTIGALFFRNSINLGLPILTMEGVSALFKEGDEAEVNLRSGEIKNLVTGQLRNTRPIAEELIEILKAGGIVPFLAKEAREGRLYQQKPIPH